MKTSKEIKLSFDQDAKKVKELTTELINTSRTLRKMGEGNEMKEKKKKLLLLKKR